MIYLNFIFSIAVIVISLILVAIVINISIVAVSFAIELEIFKIFNIHSNNSLSLTMAQIALASIVCFCITLIAYLLIKYVLKKERIFKQYFEISYLVIMYISGLITLLKAIMPQLILENSLLKFNNFLSGDGAAGIALFFFVSISNYTLFKNLILERKIFFMKEDVNN